MKAGAADDPIDIATLRQMRDGLLRNIRSLATDVEILYEAGRYARTCALGILCGEEFAKLLTVDACLSLKRIGQPIGWTAIWKELQRHENKLWMFVGLSDQDRANPPKTWRDFIAAMGRSTDGWEHAAKLNKFKQDAIYVGLRNGAISIPDDRVTREQAGAIRTSLKGVVMLLEAVVWE